MYTSAGVKPPGLPSQRMAKSIAGATSKELPVNAGITPATVFKAPPPTSRSAVYQPIVAPQGTYQPIPVSRTPIVPPAGVMFTFNHKGELVPVPANSGMQPSTLAFNSGLQQQGVPYNAGMTKYDIPFPVNAGFGGHGAPVQQNGMNDPACQCPGCMKKTADRL